MLLPGPNDESEGVLGTRQGVKFHSVSKTVKYLFLDDPWNLRDNRKVILKMAKTTEKILNKDDLTEEANNQ